MIFPRQPLSPGRLIAALLALAVAASAPLARTQDAPNPERAHLEEVLKGLNRGKGIGQVALSPDGKHLAWIEGGRGGGAIQVAPYDDLARTVRLTAATQPTQRCHESQIAWSPDSKSVAFFSDCAKPGGQSDLYLAKLDGTSARQLTELKGFVNAPAFSPDGTQIAFLYVDGATRQAGALAAMKAPSGVIGEDGIEIQRVAVAQVDAAKPMPAAMVSPENLHVYEFDWAPDSKGLAYIAADPPGENNWWVAKLYTQRLGSAPSSILAPAEVAGPLHGLQIAVPRWSPDGKSIAFIGGLMSDQGSTGGDVWIVSSKGGEPRDLTTGRPTSPAWIEWAGSDHLFVTELSGGNSQLVKYTLHGDPAAKGEVNFGSPIFSIPGTVGDGRMEMSLSDSADRSLVRVPRQHLRSSD